MKRNRFRLETVLRIRRIQEDIELGKAMQARSVVTRAEQQEAEHTLAYHDVVALSAQTAHAVSFLADRSRLDRFGDSVVASQHDVAEAEVVLDERRVEWSSAAQRVSALVRLQERHTHTYRANALAEEVNDADERTTQRRLSAPDPSTPSSPVGAPSS